MSSSLSAGATAAIPPKNPIIASANVSGGVAVTLYTVPAGRTFYCTQVTAGCSNTGWLQILIEATQIYYFDMVEAQVVTINGDVLFAMNAGEDLNIDDTGGSGHTVTVSGFIL